MDKNRAIEIEPAKNGWVVRPAYRNGGYEVRTMEDLEVFRTLADLMEWLGNHFSHRESVVPLDDSSQAVVAQ